VPGTPERRNELIEELDHHAYILNVENRLVAFGNALQSINQGTERAHWYLMKLDTNTSQLVVTGFQRDEYERATASYLEVEELVRKNSATDAVLVSVDSLTALERAYPNYFADTRVFVELMKQALSGHQRKIFNLAPIKRAISPRSSSGGKSS